MSCGAETETIHLTGFSLAAETLHFRTAIDRTGGAFDSRELFEPSENQFPYLLDCLYGYLKARDGLEVEKLRLGATGQIGGSSMLKLESGKVDLSRRQAVYRLLGMSFREYLAFEKVIDHRVIGFDELLSDHRRIASAVAEQTKILPHFER